MRTYTLRFGTMAEYFYLYRRFGRDIQTRILGEPIGYYVTEVGKLNQIIHLWRYQSFEERIERRSRLWENADWKVFASSITSFLLAQESKLMIDAPLR